MIKLSKTFDNVGVLNINYKIGEFFDRCFIEFELGEYKEFHLKKRREFMKSIEIEVKKEKKSRAADMAKSRAKASFLRDVRLTPKAEENLKKICESTGLNKTQVINKLLEEQEQLSLL